MDIVSLSFLKKLVQMPDACVIDLDRSAEERDGISVHGSGRGDDRLVVAMERDGNSMRKRWQLLPKEMPSPSKGDAISFAWSCLSLVKEMQSPSKGVHISFGRRWDLLRMELPSPSDGDTNSFGRSWDLIPIQLRPVQAGLRTSSAVETRVVCAATIDNRDVAGVKICRWLGGYAAVADHFGGCGADRRRSAARTAELSCRPSWSAGTGGNEEFLH